MGKIRLVSLAVVPMLMTSIACAAQQQYNTTRSTHTLSRPMMTVEVEGEKLHECSWDDDQDQSRGSSHGMGKAARMGHRDNIAQTLLDDWTYEDFAKMLRAGNRNIIHMLEVKGPFTVFAPSNKAYELMPKSDFDALLRPQSRTKLGKFLKYHIVIGCYSAKDLKRMTSLRTVDGAELTISSKDGSIFINGVRISDEDVRATNGVIHGIDKPLELTANPGKIKPALSRITQ